MSDNAVETQATTLDFLNGIAQSLEAERRRFRASEAARVAAEAKVATLTLRENSMKQLMNDLLIAHQKDGGAVVAPIPLAVADDMPPQPDVTHGPVAPLGLEVALHPPVVAPTAASVVPTPAVAAPAALPVGTHADGTMGLASSGG